MSRFKRLFLLLALLVCGCGKDSTATLIENLKAPDALTRLTAARMLAQRPQDAAQIVFPLVQALKDADGDVRCSAADSLASFHEKARDALPALQAALEDREPKVRAAAARAQSFIDPEKYPEAPKH